MPCASRREAICAAVDAHNRAHPAAPLPRPATRLLAAMFDTEDVCCLRTLKAQGFGKALPKGAARPGRGRLRVAAGGHVTDPGYLPAAASREGGRSMTPPLSRRREIEAAIAAYNSADRETLLPPSAVRLLAVMFPRDGFDERTVHYLLRALADVCQRTLTDLEAHARHGEAGVPEMPLLACGDDQDGPLS